MLICHRFVLMIERYDLQWKLIYNDREISILYFILVSASDGVSSTEKYDMNGKKSNKVNYKTMKTINECR